MKTKLEERLSIGKQFQQRLSTINKIDELNQLEYDFEIWDKYNEDLIKLFFSDRKIYQEYHSIIYLGNLYADRNSLDFKLKQYNEIIPRKNQNLESIINRFHLLGLNPQNIESKSEITMKKIFISHSSLDAQIVEKVLDILVAIGVPHNQIFCSSFEGYGVKLGEDFLERIKVELNTEVLVLFILSQNFFNSPVCLCEMGATWIKTNKHIPILVPPLEYKDIKGVIPHSQGLIITEPLKWNSLKEDVQNFLSLNTIDASIWERKRTKILKEIETILAEISTSDPSKKKVDTINKIQQIILNRFIELKSKPNHVIDQRWITNHLIPQLNPKEIELFDSALGDLIAKDYVSFEERSGFKCIVLRQEGFDKIYD